MSFLRSPLPINMQPDFPEHQFSLIALSDTQRKHRGVWAVDDVSDPVTDVQRKHQGTINTENQSKCWPSSGGFSSLNQESNLSNKQAEIHTSPAS